MSTDEPAPVTQSPDQFAEVRELLASGNKIGAIKRLREQTSWGLADAKRYVDALAAGLPPPATPPPAAPVKGRARRFYLFVVVLWIVIGIADLVRGHVLEGIGDLAFAAVFAAFLGTNFGLRGRTVAVLGWVMFVVYMTITILRWTGHA